MKPIAAEIRPSVDLEKLRLRWDLACGKESQAEKTLAETRLEKGRVLVEARRAFPARGPKAKGWGELLVKWGIEQPTAWRYMELAGYVEREEVSCNMNETASVPTYAEAGVIKAETEPQSRSLVEDLIEQGIAPVEAAIQLSSDASIDWMQELERLGESMRKAARSLFSSAEAMDALCRQHEASIASPAAMTMRTMLVAAKTSIQKTLQLMNKEGEK